MVGFSKTWYLAPGRSLLGNDEVERCCLPGTIRAQQTEHLPGFYGECQVPHSYLKWAETPLCGQRKDKMKDKINYFVVAEIISLSSDKDFITAYKLNNLGQCSHLHITNLYFVIPSGNKCMHHSNTCLYQVEDKTKQNYFGSPPNKICLSSKLFKWYVIRPSVAKALHVLHLYVPLHPQWPDQYTCLIDEKQGNI